MILVLLAVAGGAAAVLTMGGDDGADRRAAIRGAEAVVRAAALPPAERGDELCDLLTDDSRERLVELVALGTDEPRRQGCAAAVAYVAWRLRPITAGRDVPAADWDVDVEGDAATIRRGDTGVLRLERTDDVWRADLAADPVWAHRARVAEACTRAGRTLALQPLPSPTPSGVRRALGLRARALEILARRVARDRPPAVLAASDRRLVRAVRGSARRLRAGARRAGTGLSGALRTLPIRGGDRTELVSQLPVPVARILRKAVGSCYIGTTAVADARGARRIAGRCERTAAELGRLIPVRSAAAAATYFAAVARNLDRVRRGVAQLTPAPGQERIARALRGQIRALVSGTRGLVADIRSGRGFPLVRLDRLELRADVVDIGVGQLGVLCTGDFGDRAAPIGSLA
ncbi:hypothetical protein AB0L40_19105 [Patulibacter sp. NPDC049589]|uniref:hypothetical protein n=1 Tax=Patulibacter sp. NPDC049589 TaxID=3154731 RepID=UPI00341266C0